MPAFRTFSSGALPDRLPSMPPLSKLGTILLGSLVSWLLAMLFLCLFTCPYPCLSAAPTLDASLQASEMPLCPSLPQEHFCAS